MSPLSSKLRLILWAKTHSIDYLYKSQNIAFANRIILRLNLLCYILNLLYLLNSKYFMKLKAFGA